MKISILRLKRIVECNKINNLKIYGIRSIRTALEIFALHVKPIF